MLLYFFLFFPKNLDLCCICFKLFTLGHVYFCLFYFFYLFLGEITVASQVTQKSRNTDSKPQLFTVHLYAQNKFFSVLWLGVIFFLIFIYLFMAVLGLRFCARAFSSCGKWGPLFIAVRGPLTIGLSCRGAQAPDAQAQQLWLTGLVAPQHVGSSQTRARTRVLCTGRQILNHCATREAPRSHFGDHDSAHLCSLFCLTFENE